MAREKSAQRPEAIDIARTFEQPSDAVSFYSDYTQIARTAEEVVFQMYESIPGAPGSDGHVHDVKSRLRATVVMSHGAATRLANLILSAKEKSEAQK